MRLLHVIDTLDHHPGHVSMSLRGLLAGLDKAGVICDIVAGASHDEAVEHWRFGGETVVVDEDDAGAMLEAVAPMARHADVVHIHAPQVELAKFAAAGAAASHTPLLVSPYGEMIKGLRGRGKLSIWLENRRFAKKFAAAKSVVCLNDEEQGFMRARGLRGTFRTISFGFDGDVVERAAGDGEAIKFPWDDGKRVIAYFGDIDGRLGLVQFFKACDELEDELEDWRIVVAGRPINNWLELFQAGARRHGKEHLGDFVVYPDAAQQRAVLDAAELVVLPAPTPVPPVAALWAMWHGKAVLASTATGLSEVESAGAGAVVEPTRKGILGGLDRLVTRSAEELRAQGEAAQRLVRERWHWSKLLDEHLELYRTMIG